jgi:hypothetical protein
VGEGVAGSSVRWASGPWGVAREEKSFSPQRTQRRRETEQAEVGASQEPGSEANGGHQMPRENPHPCKKRKGCGTHGWVNGNSRPLRYVARRAQTARRKNATGHFGRDDDGFELRTTARSW